MYILNFFCIYLAASEVENEFIFQCPVPKDFDYTLTLRSSTNILTYDSKTSMKEISEQWRNKVTFHPENGTIILSDLNQEQMGTYTCESTTAHNRYTTQAKIQSSGNISKFLLSMLQIQFIKAFKQTQK